MNSIEVNPQRPSVSANARRVVAYLVMRTGGGKDKYSRVHPDLESAVADVERALLMGRDVKARKIDAIVLPDNDEDLS